MRDRASRSARRPRGPLLWLALATVYLAWGGTYVAIRVAIRTVPPLLMAGFRFLIAGSILYLFAAREAIGTMIGSERRARRSGAGGRRPDPIKARHWRSALIVGASLLLGANGAITWALQRIPSGITALLVATVPLWLVLLDRLFFGHRLSRRAFLGLGGGFGGVALLVSPHPASSSIDLLAAGVVILAAACWAAGSLYSRRAPVPDRPLMATAMQMLAGGACLIVTGLAVGEASRIDLGRISPSSFVAIGYLILFGSLAAHSAYMWLLSAAPTALVATYAYVNPVVAVFLGWAILGEPITASTLTAAAIILAGVAMILSAPEQNGGRSDGGRPARPEPGLRAAGGMLRSGGRPRRRVEGEVDVDEPAMDRERERRLGPGGR